LRGGTVRQAGLDYYNFVRFIACRNHVFGLSTHDAKVQSKCSTPEKLKRFAEKPLILFFHVE
jgi:hypothetical protein